MKKPVRIQRSRQHKQTSPNGLEIVYVGRGSRWGNPFRVVGDDKKGWRIKTEKLGCSKILESIGVKKYNTRNEAADDAIKCYVSWLFPYTHKKGDLSQLLLSIANLKDIEQNLKGKNLSCWCKKGDSCHADVLLGACC